MAINICMAIKETEDLQNKKMEHVAIQYGLSLEAFSLYTLSQGYVSRLIEKWSALGELKYRTFFVCLLGNVFSLLKWLNFKSLPLGNLATVWNLLSCIASYLAIWNIAVLFFHCHKISKVKMFLSLKYYFNLVLSGGVISPSPLMMKILKKYIYLKNKIKRQAHACIYLIDTIDLHFDTN